VTEIEKRQLNTRAKEGKSHTLYTPYKSLEFETLIPQDPIKNSKKK